MKNATILQNLVRRRLDPLFSFFVLFRMYDFPCTTIYVKGLFTYIVSKNIKPRTPKQNLINKLLSIVLRGVINQASISYGWTIPAFGFARTVLVILKKKSVRTKQSSFPNDRPTIRRHPVSPDKTRQSLWLPDR